MSRGAQAIVEAIDALPAPEREEVVVELLRRVAQSDHSSPSDQELTAAADEVFQALDKHETSNR
jgi:hypothetical protein